MSVQVGDIVRIVAEMRLLTSEDIANIYHFKTVINTTADDLAFMTDVASRLDPVYQAINLVVTAGLDYVAISGQNITRNELMPTVGWPTLVAGADGGVLLPTQTSGFVFFRTLTPKVRASKFLAGFTESSNFAGGTIGAAAGTALANYAIALLAGLTTANIDLDYGAYNAALARFTPVTSYIIPTRWRTQRRRRVGVGS